MGISKKDIRIFYNRNTHDYIIANDYKKRMLLDKGYSIEKAEKESHGHINKRRTAEKIRDNILSNRKEKSRDIWILGCYVRVCDKSYKHYSWICGLYKSRQSKDKQRYFNSNKGTR